MIGALIIMPYYLIVSITNLNSNVNKLYMCVPREIILVGNNNDVFACIDVYKQNVIVKFVISVICYNIFNTYAKQING